MSSADDLSSFLAQWKAEVHEEDEEQEQEMGWLTTFAAAPPPSTWADMGDDSDSEGDVFYPSESEAEDESRPPAGELMHTPRAEKHAWFEEHEEQEDDDDLMLVGMGADLAAEGPLPLDVLCLPFVVELEYWAMFEEDMLAWFHRSLDKKEKKKEAKIAP